MKVTIVHRWDGSPTCDWIPWLKKELESKGYQVNVPSMPNTSEPEINAWVEHLKKQNPEGILIGHSIGCQTILRYLEKYQNKNISKIVLVAPWITLQNLEDEESEAIAEPWLDTPIDFNKIKKLNIPCTRLLSDDDPYVPVTDEKIFKEKLGAKTIILCGKEHFNGKKYKEILEQVL